MKQIETLPLSDPIMRRLYADREEKRVTRGSETDTRKKVDRSSLTSTPNQRGLLDEGAEREKEKVNRHRHARQV